MSDIKHETYSTLFQDMNSDPLGKNEYSEKPEKITKYCIHWRNINGPPTPVELKATIIDHLADHTPGGIALWVVGTGIIPVMKAVVGFKKYTSNPTCITSTLMGHYYGIVGDGKDSGGEIIKFNFDVLELSPQVNVYKEMHHKKKVKDDPSIILMPPIKDDDVQCLTICTRNAMFVPFFLMQYVLDKDLNPCEAFLLLHDIIKAAKLIGCKGLLDFYHVGGTLATGVTVPTLARATAVNMTAMSVSRPLIQIFKTKVLQQDLKGLIPDTTKIDPIARQMSNAVIALTNAHIRTDAANEALLESESVFELRRALHTPLNVGAVITVRNDVNQS